MKIASNFHMPVLADVSFWSVSDQKLRQKGYLFHNSLFFNAL